MYFANWKNLFDMLLYRQRKGDTNVPLNKKVPEWWEIKVEASTAGQFKSLLPQPDPHSKTCILQNGTLKNIDRKTCTVSDAQGLLKKSFKVIEQTE